MVFVLEEICDDLIKDLSSREREIILRRFGLGSNKERESLQTIGDDLGITRERVRQLQNKALTKIKTRKERHVSLFRFFYNYLKTTGSLRKEEPLLKTIDPEKDNYVFFFLSLEESFKRKKEDEEFHTLWMIEEEAITVARKVTSFFVRELEKIGEPLETKEVVKISKFSLNISSLLSFLEASQLIEKGPHGLWGIKDWAEINPRGMRDASYLVLKKEKKPLHFREIAELINHCQIFKGKNKKALPSTVHNELIKDERFVLIGRGIYALSEWGYRPGYVRDIIVAILKEKGPLTREEIITEVLKQRLVKKSTILLNLKNEIFQRDDYGRYRLKE